MYKSVNYWNIRFCSFGPRQLFYVWQPLKAQSCLNSCDCGTNRISKSHQTLSTYLSWRPIELAILKTIEKSFDSVLDDPVNVKWPRGIDKTILRWVPCLLSYVSTIGNHLALVRSHLTTYLIVWQLWRPIWRCSTEIPKCFRVESAPKKTEIDLSAKKS